MKRKIITVVLVALAMVSLACGFHFSTARIIEAQLAREVNEKKEVVAPTTAFDSNEQVIHVVVRLATAPDNTKVKARWLAVKVEGTPEHQLIAETNVDAGGSNNIIDFTLTPSETGLPPGDYKVDLYLNPQEGKHSQPARTLNFTVKASGPAIAQATMAKGSDGESPTTVFPRDEEKLYCYVQMRGKTAGAKVSAHWIAVEAQGVDPNFEIDRSQIALEGDQNLINFSLTRPANGWPPGKYRVDLFMGDSSEPVRSLPFNVALVGERATIPYRPAR
jgi:hypothetical protein